MSFGERVKEARKRAQLSQEALARLADMSLPGVAKIEQGGVVDPHYWTLHRLAKALGVNPLWLVTGEQAEEPVPLDVAPEEAGPSPEAGDKERRIIDASPAAFQQLLSEAPSDADLLGLYHRIAAEHVATELAYREDEDNRTAYRDYARAIERYMMAVLSLNIRGVLPPDPELLAARVGELEALRK